jgi:hypothetical protein
MAAGRPLLSLLSTRQNLITDPRLITIDLPGLIPVSAKAKETGAVW